MRGIRPEESLEILRRFDEECYWYLGQPYTKYKSGLERAYVEGCQMAAFYTHHGINVLSPIAHSHSVAVHSGDLNLDPKDPDIWMPPNFAYMAGARGLIVLKLHGWEDSEGLAQEIRYFTSESKPILYVEIPKI